MELIKGDKVKQVKSIKGFDFVGKIFTVVGVNKNDNNISLRFSGSNKELFPFMSCVPFDDPFTFSINGSLFKNEQNKTAYFEKVYEWTPWRKLKFENTLLSNYIIIEALYKTNRKKIEFKINGDKVKVTCHKNDKFNLDKGIEIGINRWIEKYGNKDIMKKGLKYTANALNEAGKSLNNAVNKIITLVNIKEVNKDLLEMPCYYYIAHCISTDYNLVGYTAKRINEFYNMKKKLQDNYDFDDLTVGEVYLWDNVFNLVTNEPYKKMTIENLTSCVKDLAKDCRQLEILHLAIPRFGGRKGNLDWEEVKKMIIEVFNEEYVPYDNASAIEIVVCDNSNSILDSKSTSVQDLNVTNTTTIGTPINTENSSSITLNNGWIYDSYKI